MRSQLLTARAPTAIKSQVFLRRRHFARTKAWSEKQSSSNFYPMDLPDEIAAIITSSLSPEDRIRLMAVCRGAAHTAVPSSGITLQITKDTKFAGIRKVLDAFPAQIHMKIICPDKLTQIIQPSYDSLSAVDMIMGMVPSHNMTGIASSCHWECITKVTIQGTMMQCLVPQFIAAACPQLRELTIVSTGASAFETDLVFTNKAVDSQPLTVCTSLTQLEFQVTGWRSLLLPPAYHSPAELRHNLPNINTLKMAQPCDALLEAFSTQLTRLEIRCGADKVQPLIHQCFDLECLHADTVVLPRNPAKLRVLNLPELLCSDSDYEQLLQLPNLSMLRLAGVVDIRQDWSSHACSWQELYLKEVEFTSLAELSLSSVQKLSTGPDAVIILPDPSNVSNRTAVQQAADNLAHVGQIVLEETYPNADVSLGRCGTVYWDAPYSNEQGSAQLIRVASQRIGPAKICHIHNLQHSPLLLSAVCDWGRLFLESVCCAEGYPLLPHVWQQLHQLQRLSTVVFWSVRNPDNLYDIIDSNEWGDNEPSIEDLKRMEVTDICRTARGAAQHYVIPTSRSIRIEFGVFYVVSEEEYPGDNAQPGLQTAIQDALPAGSKLASIEFCSLNDRECYTYPDKLCDTNQFWVIVLEPSQPSV